MLIAQLFQLRRPLLSLCQVMENLWSVFETGPSETARVQPIKHATFKCLPNEPYENEARSRA